MKEKTVGVYCPSYRRSDCIMTQNILNDVTYVVRASEEEAYRNAGVRKLISAPDEEINSMSKVRQWILDNSPEDIIVQVDDDIKQQLFVLTAPTVCIFYAITSCTGDFPCCKFHHLPLL